MRRWKVVPRIAGEERGTGSAVQLLYDDLGRRTSSGGRNHHRDEGSELAARYGNEVVRKHGSRFRNFVRREVRDRKVAEILRSTERRWAALKRKMR